MPEFLKSLTAVLVLAGVAFAIMRPHVVAAGIAPGDFARRRNIWLALTITAFVAHSFWLYIAVAAVLVYWGARRDSNPLALYVFLLICVPAVDRKVPGFGLINFLMEIDHLRLLSLALLLPLALRTPRGRLVLADYMVLGYLLIQLGLRMPWDSATNLIRTGVYLLLDIGLPYYVASRCIRNAAALRDVLLSFAAACSVTALIAIFETTRTWALYNNIAELLNADFGYRDYLRRAGTLRAVASAGQAIVLGYVLAVAVLLFDSARVRMSTWVWWLAALTLLGGAMASISRGPLIGLAAGWIVMRAFGPDATRNTFRTVGFAAAAVVAIALSPLGEQLVEYIPFVGSIDDANVTYRQRLFDTSLDLIIQSPWFGVYNFYGQLVDLGLKQGQGIVDLVNTYLGITLAYGVIALALFVGAHLAGLLPLAKVLLVGRKMSKASHLMGASILGAAVAALLTIITASSVLAVPYVYWLLTGLCVRFVALQRRGALALRPVAQKTAVAGLQAPALAARPASA